MMTHCQVLGDDLIAEMARQGVLGNVQPSFTITDAVWASKRLDVSVQRTSYCWKSMLDAGIQVMGGSDCPIETCDPFQGMADAMCRDGFNPSEALTFTQALDLYTIGPAFAAGEELRLGCIATGFLADFVIVGQRSTEVPSSRPFTTPRVFEDPTTAFASEVWVNGVCQVVQSQPSLLRNDGSGVIQGDFSHGKNGPIRICQCCR